MTHHLYIYKMRGFESHPWRIECACGEWQQATKVSMLWKYIDTFRHIQDPIHWVKVNQYRRNS